MLVFHFFFLFFIFSLWLSRQERLPPFPLRLLLSMSPPVNQGDRGDGADGKDEKNGMFRLVQAGIRNNTKAPYITSLAFPLEDDPRFKYVSLEDLADMDVRRWTGTTISMTRARLTGWALKG
jgi:hypothetical protein